MRLSPRLIARALVGLAAVAVCLVAAGCAKPIGSVSGKVYYNDTLLKGGHVIFAKVDGQPQWAEIKEDGSYSFDKIVAGPVKIGVETSTLRPNPGRRVNPAPADAQNQPKQSADPAELAKRYTYIPEKYEDPQQSGKEYTVKSGKQEYDIKLP